MDSTQRFKGADWFDTVSKTSVVVVGCGGIGSWLTLLLARAGFQMIYVYDGDKFDDSNISGQFCTIDGIGEYKSEHVSTLASSFVGSDHKVVPCTGFYNEKGLKHKYVLSGLDNMGGRRLVYDMWKDFVKQDGILIDGRLLLEQLQIYSVTPATAEKYSHEALFDDALVQGAPCSMKQTSHNASLIASLMVNLFINHLTQGRKTPYYLEYFTPLMLQTQKTS